MKKLLRKFVPHFVLQYYRRVKRSREQKRNQGRSVEEVFTEIYEMNKWGGAQGEFCSGSGSSNKEVVSAYISMVAGKASSEFFSGMDFVDLGCGDFNVGQQIQPLCSNYVGVDVVKPLVERNRELYGNESIQFQHLDIVNDELPAGEVCFIRQVFQHLSNAHIEKVLRKLAKYKWVFITEHYPTDNDGIVPNKDKVHGGDVRVYDNSGVYLTEPPFSLPEQHLELVLEVSGTQLGESCDAGVIRTYLYKPQSA